MVEDIVRRVYDDASVRYNSENVEQLISQIIAFHKSARMYQTRANESNSQLDHEWKKYNLARMYQTLVEYHCHTAVLTDIMNNDGLILPENQEKANIADKDSGWSQDKRLDQAYLSEFYANMMLSPMTRIDLDKQFGLNVF